MRHRGILICVLFLCGCGSALPPESELDPTIATFLDPILTRAAPIAGRAGDTITLFGFGFSVEHPNNLVHIGGTITPATSYALVNPAIAGEIERLTFTVPAAATVGATTVFLSVFDRASNNSVAFTVLP
ncbi:MAG: IPT/TIG domain-containing protein [Deltaproteobacteria bacterium]|nr:IPT/TIG domain-containing protein [Deltaproteobacteria bacterium]